MPSNGLAFPVFVSSQPNITAFGGFFKLVNNLLLLRVDLVRGFKVLLDINAEFFFWQVPDMAEGALCLKFFT